MQQKMWISLLFGCTCGIFYMLNWTRHRDLFVEQLAMGGASVMAIIKQKILLASLRRVLSLLLIIVSGTLILRPDVTMFTAGLGAGIGMGLVVNLGFLQKS